MQNTRLHHGPASLREWTAWACGRMRRDNDVVIAVVGETGKGKSSFATLLMRKLQDHPVQPDKQFIWQADQLIHHAKTLPEFSCLVMDEAIVGGGNRRRAMSTANVDLQEHLNTCRTYHHAVLFLAPQFADLDMAIQTRCTHVFEIVSRGEVVVHELQKNQHLMERSTWPEARFVDEFPDPAKHEDPEVRQLWSDYKRLKDAFSFNGKDPLAVERMKFREMVREVLQGIDLG